MNLEGWHVRLKHHFSQLRDERRTAGNNLPIFALEHGLDENELNALAIEVCSQIKEGPPSPEYTLPWIIYATEFGYQYSGYQYWQTFESETPGWIINGDRNWIRDCFRTFQKSFDGVIPSGLWAEHFTIICWPITHAVLPRDLQRELARILYELRHSFSAELFESPNLFGEYISARSWNSTSRFRNFAQETSLVGQIATALLLQGQHGTNCLIQEATLHRIRTDLNRERLARDWLQRARRFAEEGTQIHGLSSKRSPISLSSDRREEIRNEITILGIEPRLVLCPVDAAGESWNLQLEVPDLSHLLLRFPQARRILSGSRCVVAGSDGRPFAREYFLHGRKRISLVRWPLSDEVLLLFEQTDPQLEVLLGTECLLRPGDMRLFRVASDKLAYELRSLRVRPGERYIIVKNSGPLDENAYIRPVTLECEGVSGGLIDIPEAITSDLEDALRMIGIGHAKTIDVWPAGLAAAIWDGEGHGEWLAAERPCLAVRTDHPIDALYVSLTADNGPPLEIKPIVPGEPYFIELPQLPIGLHTVQISARRAKGDPAEPIGDLNVVMRIREARQWDPGVNPHGALIVQLDPAVPSLEQIWEGRVEFFIQGPTGRNIKCQVSLFERDNKSASFVKQLPPITLPITGDDWQLHFEKHFTETKEAQDNYDTSMVCKLEFQAEELGTFTVRCEREFTPLRWAVRHIAHKYVVRLLDDTGSTEQPNLFRIDFETPLLSEPVKVATQYDVPDCGGMYVARIGEFVSAVIVPPAVKTLADISCFPRINDHDRSVDAVVNTVEFALLWGNARLPGDLISAIRQRDVLHAFIRHIFRLLGGEHWAVVEDRAWDSGSGLVELKRAIPKRPNEAAIAVLLFKEYAELSTATTKDRIKRVAEVTSKFLSIRKAPQNRVTVSPNVIRLSGPAKTENTEWLSEFALRLASDPTKVVAWAGPELREAIAKLFELPTLARAARFLVVAIDRHLQSHRAKGELYAGWRWL